MLAIDHVVFVVDDLAAASRRLRARFGLASSAGGRHPGHGTANEIVPLGDSYLELLAVVDPLEAGDSPFGRWVDHQAAEVGAELRVAALCLRSDGLDAIAERLETKPAAMARTTPDGTTVSWRLVGLDSAITDSLPFFIAWDGAPALHPGRAPADHQVVVQGIEWVEVGGDEARLWQRLGRDRVPLRAVGGAPGYGRLALATMEGSLLLGQSRN